MNGGGNLLPLRPGECRIEGYYTPCNDPARARSLRRTATPAERKLWQRMRDGTLGTKTRQQYPCGRYILDFGFFQEMPAIEIDGDTHLVGEGLARDAVRTAWPAAEGWCVLRFTNHEVLENSDGVVQTITEALRRSPQSSPLPGGEGA